MADYASSLPVRTEVLNATGADVQVAIADGTTGTQLWNIDANGIGQVNLNDGTNALTIGSNGEITTIVSDGTDTIAIDSNGNLSTIITDGTDVMDVNTDGSINVNVVESTQGDQVHAYNTLSPAAPATPATVVTYTVTALKTFLLKGCGFAASGKAKFTLKAGTPSSETTRAVAFLTTAQGFGELTFSSQIEVIAGDNILIVGENMDKQNQDLYAWINGTEV
jgi:hypothetical protein